MVAVELFAKTRKEQMVMLNRQEAQFDMKNPFLKHYVIESVMEMFIKKRVKVPKKLLDEATKNRQIFTKNSFSK